MIYNFKLAANLVRDGVWKLVYDANRPIVLKRLWWDWVWMATGRSGLETVSIYLVQEGVAGFSNGSRIGYETNRFSCSTHKRSLA